MTATKQSGTGFALLQRIGRSLMLPIASLPVAGLLLRFGAADVLGANGLAGKIGDNVGGTIVQAIADLFSAAGGAIFGNLPLIFAIGVAVGFARKSDGSTGLAAVIGYLTYTATLSVTALWKFGSYALAGHYYQVNDGVASGKIDYGVLGGILIGILAAVLYQKYYRIKLPTFLAFFGGRRFVPIITALYSIILGIVLSFIFPIFDWIINTEIGGWLERTGTDGGIMAGLVGLVFGVINRLLIPLGLHHLVNNIVWFQLGSCETANGPQHGDINCFYNAIDGTGAWSGNFMTGFFPILMFALPAATLAFVHTARPEQRKATAGLMVSVALTAFLTGITEPVEFAFAYAAFPLYAVHAVFTGCSLFVANVIGAKMGFSFSAGFTDFLLSSGRSAELSGGWFHGPIMIIILGLIWAVIYYFVFRFLINKFDYATPGRQEGDAADTMSMVVDQGK